MEDNPKYTITFDNSSYIAESLNSDTKNIEEVGLI